MAARTPTRIVKFGVFEVNPEAGELRKSGMRQKLAGQPFQVLQLLLEHPQEIVSREEMRRRIWPQDTYVDYDLGLRRAITRLREVLGDSAESPRFIETIPRRGYRFIAPLNTNGDAFSAAELPTQHAYPTRSGRAMPIGIVVGSGAAVALLLGLGFVSTRLNRRESITSAAPQIRSVAVLPLQNLSNDPTQEYFAEGMTDALITELAQNSSLKVISRTSSMQYKETKKALPEIAHELNVDGIVEGTVQRSGDRVRITAQLIHGPSDKHLWASSYERDLHDVFSLEREVTDDIASQVSAQIAPHGQPSVQSRPLNLSALDAYLQGKYHLNKERMGPRDEELRKAGEFFQHAIDADPALVPAYIGLAEAHHNLWWPSSEDFAIMAASAAKALELAPDSSDAHCEVGVTKWEEWDWIGAEEETKRAIGLNPNNADARGVLGYTLDAMGRLDEAWKEFEIAQQLDPNQDYLSWPLYRRGQYDRSIELVRRMAEAHPDNGSYRLLASLAYAQNGMHAASVQELKEFLRLFGLPETATRVDRAFAHSGWKGALLQWARELERLMATKQAYFPGILAQVYVWLGYQDRAFYWLEQGNEHRHLAIADPVLQFVKVDPSFAPLHSDPRFKILLRNMELPE